MWALQPKLDMILYMTGSIIASRLGEDNIKKQSGRQTFLWLSISLSPSVDRIKFYTRHVSNLHQYESQITRHTFRIAGRSSLTPRRSTFFILVSL